MREVWDELARTARARHFMFERHASIFDYHQDRIADASFLITWSGRPIALLPASQAVGRN